MKLNVGSGPQVVPGWVSIDKSWTPVLQRSAAVVSVLRRLRVMGPEQQPWPVGVRRIDVTKGLPFETDTVEAIYSSHFLEHLSSAEVETFLRDARRVLKPGGCIRLVLPDLRQGVTRYQDAVLSGDAHAADEFVRFLYMAPPLEGNVLRRLALGALHRPHGWMYDVDSLGSRMRDAGFADVRARDFRVGRCPDVEILETRPESFFLEASAA